MPTQIQFTIAQIAKIIEDIKDIRYHMDVLNREGGEQRDAMKDLVNELKETNKAAAARGLEITKVSTDVEWLKKAYWVIFTASAGSFVAAMANLLVRAK